MLNNDDNTILPLTLESSTNKIITTPPAAIDSSTNVSVQNDAVKTAGLASTRPKRNVGTYKDGPAKERLVKKDITQSHVYHRCERQYIKAVKKNIRQDNPTMAQAKKRKDWPEFEKAIQAEYQQMFDDEVYTKKSVKYKELPKDANLLGTMFTLTVKRNPSTGAIEKYKARLVALGNQQKESSYDQIKSLTARGSSVKMLIAIQAATNAYSMVLDVKRAYLKSEIDEMKNEKLYIRLPNGNIKKLQRYLYGLKQAGKEWQDNITGYKATIDPLVFTKRKGKDYISMSIHVDDFYVISTKQSMLDEFYQLLQDPYNEVSRKTGDTVEYLGMSVSKLPNGDISISQPAYIEKMLQIAGMSEASGVSIPYTVTQVPKEDDDTPIDKNLYLSYVGLINYLACYSRPDLLYALSRVAQRCSNPNRSDMRRVMNIFRFIVSTKNNSLIFKSNIPVIAYAWVDAGFNSYEDGKSHYGHNIAIGTDSGSFHCKSGKMKNVVLSSCESEHVSLCHGGTEIIYVRRFLNDLGFPQVNPTIIYEDNQSTIKQVYGSMNHNVTKHISPKFHFVKQQVELKKISVVYTESSENTADIFTKPLNKQIFQEHLWPSLCGYSLS